MKCLLVILLILQAVSAFGQSDLDRHRRIIIGNWNWCQGIGELDTLGRPAPGSNYSGWKYAFHSKSRFIEFQKKHKNKGSWLLTNKELTLDFDDIKGQTRYPFTRPVFWLNDNLFYTTGQEGEGGVNVFSYYKRIGKKKKH